MTPGQKEQYKLLIESGGMFVADRYRRLVEAPDYMESRPGNSRRSGRTTREERRKKQQLGKARRRQIAMFGDYGNVRPSSSSKKKV